MSYSVALNNYIQSIQKLNSLTYEEKAEGPPHAVVWTVTYNLDGHGIGTGSGAQKWQAKDAAAKEAMKALGQST